MIIRWLCNCIFVMKFVEILEIFVVVNRMGLYEVNSELCMGKRRFNFI